MTQKIITRAYKTRLMPTPEQREYFVECCDVARYVYNWALGDRKSAYEERGEAVNKFEQKRRFNAWKHGNAAWVTECPYVITGAAFDHLDSAYTAFFRRVRSGQQAPGFPRFKSRHSDRQSFTLRGAITIEHDRVRLPRIGWVDLKERGYLPTNPEKLYFVTISHRAGKWYISAQVDVLIEERKNLTDAVLGMDIGYGELVVTSDGDRYENLRLMERYEKKLKRLQRELSRRKKGSANRAKTKAKLVRLHAKIANARLHHAHDITSAMADGSHGMVAIEGFDVSEMMVGDKSYARRAKKLADAGIGEIRRQVQYKSEWAGKGIVTVPGGEPTNRRCNACGAVAAKSRVAFKERWQCRSCGVEHDRRYNTAYNVAQYAIENCDSG